MSKVNPVFRVLTTSGNTAVLPVGNRTEALAVGQIGIFSNETNLSLGAASAMQDSRKFYIAVKQADGEIIKSAGFGIQRSNISAYTAQCYNPFQPKVIDIHGFKAICDTTYGIKFGYRSQQLFKDQGFQTKMQTISVKAANCEGCDPCPSGDCIALAKQLVAALTASGNFTVQYVDYETNPGTPAIVADVDAWATANPTLCIGIRLTGKQEGIFAYCGVNPLYNNPRGIGFDAYLLDGFEEGGTVSTVQEMMFEEGAGYDIRHQEEIANGWEYGPYRTSELTGLSNAGPTYATADS
mgnify:FL=1